MESIVKNIFQTLLIIGAAYSVGLVVFLSLRRFCPPVKENPVINLNEEHKKAA